MENSFIIQNLLQQKEGVRLEFKKNIDLDAIARTIAAFINTNGGDLLVGVDEQKEVRGIANATEEASRIQEYLVDNIRPTAPVSVLAVPYRGNLMVILVSVWEGAKKPYEYKNIIYTRQGQLSKTADEIRLSTLIVERKESDFQWERMPVLGAEISDLDSKQIKTTIKSYKEYKPKVKIEDNEDFLIQRGLIIQANISNGCMVLFGKKPVRYISQSRIRITVYPSDFSGDELLDDKIFEGSLFENIETIFNYFNSLFGITTEIKDRLRTERPNYPLLAIREGLLNAMVHRDYNSVNGFLKISVFSNRTEISNYGGLPEGITIRDLRTEHSSILRNPDIAHICFYRKYIEMLGGGTLRMIRDCKEKGFKPPVWQVDNNITTVIFPGLSHNRRTEGENKGVIEGVSKKLKERAEGVIEGVTEGVTGAVKLKLLSLLLLLYKKGGLRTVELEKTAKIPAKTVERYLKQLKEAGLVEFKGAARTGGYYLTRKADNKIK